MKNCYDCYCEGGLASIGIKALAKACNMTQGNLYTYFDNLDDLILQSTAHCMSKFENEQYLKPQIEILKQMYIMMKEKDSNQNNI